MGRAEYRREYVIVIASFSTDGRLRPLSLIWKDGHEYAIDRVTAVKNLAASKAGGCGMRYTIMVGSNERYLFLEPPVNSRDMIPRWFVEVPALAG